MGTRLEKIRKIFDKHKIKYIDATIALSVISALEYCEIDVKDPITDAIMEQTTELYLKDEAVINIDYLAMVSAVYVKNGLEKVEELNKWKLLAVAAKCEYINWIEESVILEELEREAYA